MANNRDPIQQIQSQIRSIKRSHFNLILSAGLALSVSMNLSVSLAQDALWHAYLEKARAASQDQSKSQDAEDFYLKAIGEAEKNDADSGHLAQLNLEAAEYFFSRRKLDPADKLLLAVANSPSSQGDMEGKVFYLQGRSKQLRNKAKEAEVLFRKSLNAPDSADFSTQCASLYRLAEIYETLGKLSESEVLLKDAAGRFYKEAQSKTNLQNLKYAVLTSREYIRRKPDDLDGSLLLAKTLLLLPGPQAEAETLLRKALEKQPDNADMHYFLSEALRRIPDKGSEAMQEVSKSIALKETEPALLERAELYGRANDFAKAKSDFLRVLDTDADSEKALAGRAQCDLLLGNREDAIAYSSRALSKNSKNSSARLVRARAYLALGRPDSAMTDIDIILSEPKPAIGTHGVRADALIQMNRFQEAQIDLIAAITEMPRDLSLKERLADSQVRGKDFQKAITTADQVLAEAPTDKYALLAKGFSLLKLGKYQDAVAVLQKNLEVNPDFNLSGQKKLIAEALQLQHINNQGDTAKSIQLPKAQP